jgi:hypothetical protein
MKTNRSILPVRQILPLAAARLALLLGFATAAHGGASPPSGILGTAGGYAIMAGSTVTNNGVTTINGDLGAANFAGAGSYVQTGGVAVSPLTPQNVIDFNLAYAGLAAMPGAVDLTGKILGTTPGAITLTPGVYSFSSTAQLTGILTLDALNQDNAVWVFQIGSTFTAAASASVVLTNLAANAVANDGVFWQVGSTTVLGAGASLVGNILGGTTFDFGSGATILEGRALTAAGTATLDGNSVDFIGLNSGYSGGLAYDGGGNVVPVTAVPEPAAFLWLAPLAALGFAGWRRRSARGHPTAAPQ